MKVIYLLIFLAGFSVPTLAQNTVIKGIVTNKLSSVRISQALITNTTKKLVTQSDERGNFEIDAAIGDTIYFSKPGFMETRLISSSLTYVVVQLSGVIRLDEIDIVGQTKRQELEEARAQYRKKGSFYAGKPPLLSYIFMPVTALYELLGKTPNQARRFNDYSRRELEQSEIDRRFNVYLVQEKTGYDGKDLQNFMDTYRPEYEAMASWNEYDLVNYILASAKTFTMAGRPSPLALPDLPKAPDLSDKTIKRVPIGKVR